jgi:hypothetical protein
MVMVAYSHKSVIVDEVEYPFPSGLYLSRLIRTLQAWPHDDELVRLLTDVTGMGSRYAKEISEVGVRVRVRTCICGLSVSARPCVLVSAAVCVCMCLRSRVFARVTHAGCARGVVCACGCVLVR